MWGIATNLARTAKQGCHVDRLLAQGEKALGGLFHIRLSRKTQSRRPDPEG